MPSAPAGGRLRGPLLETAQNGARQRVLRDAGEGELVSWETSRRNIVVLSGGGKSGKGELEEILGDGGKGFVPLEARFAQLFEHRRFLKRSPAPEL